MHRDLTWPQRHPQRPAVLLTDACASRGKSFVDVVVSLTGFALVGGPARQDAPKAVEALKKLNVPYLVSLPLVFQTTEEWNESELGLHPVQVALQASPLLCGGQAKPCTRPGGCCGC